MAASEDLLRHQSMKINFGWTCIMNDWQLKNLHGLTFALFDKFLGALSQVQHS